MKNCCVQRFSILKSFVFFSFLFSLNVSYSAIPKGVEFLFDFNEGSSAFVQPFGMTTDSSGNIYVTDFDTNLVQKFDANGGFLFSFDGTSGGPAFPSPFQIAVDNAGKIYITNDIKNLVQVFSSTGSLLFSFDGTTNGGSAFSRPNAITVDSSSNIYVTDPILNLVQVFDSSGSFLFKITGGSSPFDFLEGIALDTSRNIYVVDKNLSNVQVFNSSGSFLFSFNGTKGGGSAFIDPIGIGVDVSGNIYVTDNGFSLQNVQVFDPSGSFLFSFNGTPGGTAFEDPFAVAFNSSGTIVYVLDDVIPNVQAFKLLFPDLKILGECKKTIFLTETEFSSVIRWSLSITNGIVPVRYKIFRDGVLIDTILENEPHIFEDHNLIKNNTYNYLIVAENDTNVITSNSINIAGHLQSRIKF